MVSIVIETDKPLRTETSIRKFGEGSQSSTLAPGRGASVKSHIRRYNSQRNSLQYPFTMTGFESYASDFATK